MRLSICLNITSRISVTLALLFVITTSFGVKPASGEDFQVLSGDKIQLGAITYCLKGIDAPEIGQSCNLKNGNPFDCGHIAKTALMDLTAGAKITCRGGTKLAECTVGSCTAGGFDLSQNMVHTGWALSTEPKFAAIQARAKEKKHGLWKGKFEMPWVWRQMNKKQ